MYKASREKWTPEYRSKVYERFNKRKEYKSSQNNSFGKIFVDNLKQDTSKIKSSVGQWGTNVIKPYRPVISRFEKIGRPIANKINNIPNALLQGAKTVRRTIKSFPKPIRRAGLIGGLMAGATAMLSLSVLKGAMNQSRDIVNDRYMQDQAISKNVLNTTRMGLSAGTSRMQNMGSTMGLSNSLSRTRHGG